MNHIMLFQGAILAKRPDNCNKPLEKMREPRRAETLDLQAWNHWVQQDGTHRASIWARVQEAIGHVKTLEEEFPEHPCLQFSNKMQDR